MAHIREIIVLRDQAMMDRIAELIAHNRLQDLDQEKLAEALSSKIDAIHQTLWSGLTWLGGALATALLSIALKTLGLI